MSRLAELLLRRAILTPDQIAQAVNKQRKDGGILAFHLVALGLLTDDQLAADLQKEYRLPIIDPLSLEINQDLLQLIPATFATKHLILPINHTGSTVTIAMADPSNLVAINEVKFLTGYDVKLVLATTGSILRGIDQFYDAGEVAYDDVLSEIESEDVEFVREEDEPDVAELEKATGEAPVVKLVNALLTDAIKKRASDVHIESFEKILRVRFRIDGVLHEVMKPPVKLKAALISRIKIMASLDISERRLPQDGRIRLRLPGNHEMDFRVSVLPTIFGEKVVMRLLDKSNLQLDMTKLGFEEIPLADFKEAISRPFGMVLVTGPTGSGKTTTLYSALSELNKITENISTAEDPVEYNLVGINQVQIRDDIGLSFAAALRAFLRQDPDVLMVGEVRDFETAEIAIKAALTGHLVLSTLHTNDAPSTVNRLLNMGVEPFLVASSLNLILAQRLARVICGNCKKETDLPIESLVAVGFAPNEAKELQIYRGEGCDVCAGTGYKGRVALYEVMPVGDGLKEQILIGASSIDIKRAAVEAGMQTLRASGLTKVREGITTIEEILRVTVGD